LIIVEKDKGIQKLTTFVFVLHEEHETAELVQIPSTEHHLQPPS